MKEENKLIAEFMGYDTDNSITYKIPKFEYEVNDYGQISFEDKFSIYFDDMEFNTSWEWLMSVIDKIESLDCNPDALPTWGLQPYSVEIGSFGVQITIDNRVSKSPFSHHVDGSKLDRAFQAVIEFIKWHNKN